MEAFEKQLAQLINQHSIENVADIPDFLLAGMICRIIEAMGPSIKKTLDWHGCDSVCHSSPNAEAETSERSGDSSPATCSDFDRGVYFRSACSGLWYRCKESAGDIDAWKEDGVLHVIDESPNGEITCKTK